MIIARKKSFSGFGLWTQSLRYLRLWTMDDISDFTSGSIFKKLTFFMFPILGALILQAMYGAVDVMMVGWFGTTEGLSGVSTGSSIINLVTFVLTGLAMGITVIIGRCLGQKDEERIGAVIGASIAFFALIGVILTVLMVVFARPVSILMQAPAEALDETVNYVRICGSGLLFIIAYNVISCIFRGLGNSRLPLIFVLIACITNIIGDYVLIAVFNMDESGAALATVAAQAVSVILSLVILKKEKLPFKIRRGDIRLSGEIKGLLKVGTPVALQELLTQLSFLALVAFINRIGLEASSGYGVANKIVSFVMLIPSSLMQSMSSFVAQNVGAKREDRAKKAMLTGMSIGIVIGVVVFYLTFFHGDLVSAVFSRDGMVIERSFEYLKGFALEAIVTSILFSFIGYYNGHQETLFVMIQGLMQTLLVRLPVSYMMSTGPDPSLTMIGLAAPLATMFGIVMNLAYFFYFQKRRLSLTLQ